METILNILLFILSLSLLITIHESGHFLFAKLFKVYCLEFSVGMGPAIVSKKFKKDKETKYSIRALPIGGYVSMAGETTDNDEEKDLNIPYERTINGINPWKRAIITVAGVTFNFVSALILLIIFTFVNGVPTGDNKVRVQNDSIASSYGIRNGDKIAGIKDISIKISDEDRIYYSDCNDDVCSTPYFSTIKTYLTGYDQYDTPIQEFNDAITSAKNRLNERINAAKTTYEEKLAIVNENIDDAENNESLHKYIRGEAVTANQETIDNWVAAGADEAKAAYAILKTAREATINQDLVLVLVHPGSDEQFIPLKRTFNMQGNQFDAIGIMESTKLPNVLEAIGNAFALFGQVFVLLFKALGSLFSANGFQQLGGVVSMYKASSAMASQGAGAYIWYLALISINLGFFNLLPIPGLDGARLYISIAEGISRKRINPKVEGYLNMIGMIFLFGLMIAVTVKDIIGLF